MQLVKRRLDEIKPYPNNPRVNDGAVHAVSESIRQCGYMAPIIVDEDGVILAGHTRYKALKALGRKTAEVIVREGLTEEQKRKYRLLDNKTGELADWDYDLLAEELDGLDFEGLEMDWGLEDHENEEGEPDNKYTEKTDVPQYTPDLKAQCDFQSMVEQEKTKMLIDNIDMADIPKEVKQFLTLSAYRHLRFNYRMIANYYAQATPEIQQLMEDSALVIIDYEDAIKNGYAKLKKTLGECV